MYKTGVLPLNYGGINQMSITEFTILLLPDVDAYSIVYRYHRLPALNKVRFVLYLTSSVIDKTNRMRIFASNYKFDF